MRYSSPGLKKSADRTAVEHCIGVSKTAIICAVQDRTGSAKSEQVITGTLQICASIAKELGTDQMETSMLQTLARLCSSKNLAQAKSAVRTLTTLASREDAGEKGAASREISALYQQLVKQLGKYGSTASKDISLVVVLRVLGEIGQLRPSLFATCGDTVRKLGKQCLQAGKEKAAGKKGGKANDAQMQVREAALKMLVRGCLADGKHDGSSQVPLHVTELVNIFETMLSSESSKAKLAVAKAVLLLARKHENAITPTLMISLTRLMHEQGSEGRMVIIQKLRKQYQATKIQLALRYACLLAFCAVDPLKSVRDLAQQVLQEVVRAFRSIAQKQAAQQARRELEASTADGTVGCGAPTLPYMPEYMMTYLISFLAHRADCPDPDEHAPLEAYLPFQRIIEFLLQALMIDSEDGGHCAAALPALRKILRMIKATQDPADPTCTPKLYVLCDVALVMVTEVSAARGWPIGNFPGHVPLPRAYFSALESRAAREVRSDGESHPCASKALALTSSAWPKRGDGSHLPPGFRLDLTLLTASHHRSRVLSPAVKTSTRNVLAITAAPAAKSQQPLPGKNTGHIEGADEHITENLVSAGHASTPGQESAEDQVNGKREPPAVTSPPRSRPKRHVPDACEDPRSTDPLATAATTRALRSSGGKEDVGSIHADAGDSEQSTPMKAAPGASTRPEMKNENAHGNVAQDVEERSGNERRLVTRHAHRDSLKRRAPETSYVLPERLADTSPVLENDGRREPSKQREAGHSVRCTKGASTSGANHTPLSTSPVQQSPCEERRPPPSDEEEVGFSGRGHRHAAAEVMVASRVRAGRQRGGTRSRPADDEKQGVRQKENGKGRKFGRGQVDCGEEGDSGGEEGDTDMDAEGRRGNAPILQARAGSRMTRSKQRKRKMSDEEPVQVRIDVEKTSTKETAAIDDQTILRAQPRRTRRRHA
ncbi:hypothetical protein CYMTET_6144 [Cymbomonas tetramitiformis]|uniref:Sister chromatid cohesion protein n=1 Tax=Cymbomonas tetramitiformis TaxID=36881 RepID=A0AAE0LIS8_9CHLO|nr:hypothetical protein CYMTET_6144 [Cymbomonas tetramitiformis]